MAVGCDGVIHYSRA